MALTNMLDWAFPQTVEVVKSPFNGEIKVVKFQGRINLWVGGGEQSGELVERVWWQALIKGLTPNQISRIKTILILGLGAGSMLRFLIKIIPSAKKITGIEIDPVMIELGKKYFGLNNHPQVEIVAADAKKYLSKTREKYDLIILDVYKGGEMAKLYQDPKIKIMLNPGGILAVNLLRIYNKGVDLTSLSGFKKPRKIRVDYNQIFFFEAV